MPDRKFDDLRKSIKNQPLTREQARKLAKQAARLASPDAAKLQDKLTEAFGAIHIAEAFRGESSAARAEALELVDKAEKTSKRRKRPNKS
ncbi:hypothetical protein SAMN04488498_12143 [Mesorhizobium albiziae]|uniref:Uncharacterized protein n=1 Tax=Neomesorhizobium albiziae TaxID=335020 RepID=A0A1I4E1A3_9HYPH|nr:hypothetical protein [Mesorhizobium albiziae]SFK99003.1 hypothetical protein SAMN04488498_12143 [Mesorhizobium albiziae]